MVTPRLPELIWCAPVSSRRIGRTNNRAHKMAAMHTTKMIATVDSTRFRVNAVTGAKASAVLILATTPQLRPGRFSGA